MHSQTSLDWRIIKQAAPLDPLHNNLQELLRAANQQAQQSNALQLLLLDLILLTHATSACNDGSSESIATANQLLTSHALHIRAVARSTRELKKPMPGKQHKRSKHKHKKRKHDWLDEDTGNGKSLAFEPAQFELLSKGIRVGQGTLDVIVGLLRVCVCSKGLSEVL